MGRAEARINPIVLTGIGGMGTNSSFFHMDR